LEEIERVLRACDRRTATAAVTAPSFFCWARVGLHAVEVVALQLDDISWRAGEIMVRGKGLFHDRMPLPPDVLQKSNVPTA
jgi:integrase/recombinase XerD